MLPTRRYDACVLAVASLGLYRFSSTFLTEGWTTSMIRKNVVPRFFLSLRFGHLGMSSHRTAETDSGIPGNTTIGASPFHIPDIMMYLSNLATSTNSMRTHLRQLTRSKEDTPLDDAHVDSGRGVVLAWPRLGDADGVDTVGSICYFQASGRAYAFCRTSRL